MFKFTIHHLPNALQVVLTGNTFFCTGKLNIFVRTMRGQPALLKTKFTLTVHDKADTLL